MSNTRCRVCASFLPKTPLLHLANMPKSAQFLPDAETLHLDKGEDLDVFQCETCGLVQICNEPVPYYKEVVRAIAFSDEMRSFRREQFAAFVQRYTLRGKKVLEVGCGRGEYLSLLNETGVDGYGIEYAPQSVSDCNAQSLHVTRDYIDKADCALASGPFDAFAVFNFMEHWPDPNVSLRGIAHNLTEGGIGLVEVPNFDMILKKDLFTEFISDHIFYFTRESLETTLRLNGFEVVELNVIWHDYILSAIVRKRVASDVTAFAVRRGAITTEIADYVQRFGLNRVAIWGAGHQALAAIALLGLAGKVRYVVDSAPFKQNKFTPASHIPIVAPAHLISDPVDAVIVMAASYSDEVARVIKQQYTVVRSVAILRDTGLERI